MCANSLHFITSHLLLNIISFLSSSVLGDCFCFLTVLLPMQLSYVKSDLEEMDFIMSTRESNLTEQLLPSRHSFFIRESRFAVINIVWNTLLWKIAEELHLSFYYPFYHPIKVWWLLSLSKNFLFFLCCNWVALPCQVGDFLVPAYPEGFFLCINHWSHEHVVVWMEVSLI